MQCFVGEFREITYILLADEKLNDSFPVNEWLILWIQVAYLLFVFLLAQQLCKSLFPYINNLVN